MASTPRTVLVTGAAGFLGSALCARLVSRGDRVVGYDDLSRGRRELLPPGVELVEGDIRDAVRFRQALQEAGPEWVVHLAAMHFIPECIARPHDTMDVNVEGTRRVLDACRGISVRHFVFASSLAIYAPSESPCVEDETPLRPLEVYGESKVMGEALVRGFHAQTRVPATVLRLSNAIGRNETNPHVIPHIFESLQRSDVVELGNTAPQRDYIDSRDIADAVVGVAERANGLGVFNVATGTSHSVDDVIALLRRITGRPIAVVQDPARLRPSERMVLAADVSRIRAATGWAARFSLEETLRDLVTAYRLT